MKKVKRIIAVLCLITLLGSISGAAFADGREIGIWEYYGDAAEAVRVPFQKASASSTLTEGSTTYEPKWAMTSNGATAWVEGVKGDGIGEYLTMSFSSAQTIDLLRIHPGYANVYEKNNRPKQVEFQFSDGSVAEYQFEDLNQDVFLLLEEPVTTSYVRIVIKSVYSGKECRDTCITTVQAYLTEEGREYSRRDYSGKETPFNIADYVQVPFNDAYASSTLTEGSVVYEPAWAMTSNSTTAWVEGVKGDGIGEYLVMQFKDPQIIDMLAFHPGYACAYEKNNRPRLVEFEFSDGTTAQFEFEDKNELVYLSFAEPIATTFVKMTILSVYLGAECRDTCITTVKAFQAK